MFGEGLNQKREIKTVLFVASDLGGSKVTYKKVEIIARPLIIRSHNFFREDSSKEESSWLEKSIMFSFSTMTAQSSPEST